MSLEHVNISVINPRKTAATLTRLFGWQVRWSGAALDDGFTVHVGEPENGQSYLALYQSPKPQNCNSRSHHQTANLNHIAVTVDDLQELESRVIAEGLSPFNHSENYPGRRFYFHLSAELEIEVVSYRT
jgi:catechol 2,3-dioxygenase-like lactoylglutathione lyase family enzyme